MRIRRAWLSDREGIYRVHVTAVRVTCASHYTSQEIEGWVGTKASDTYAPPFERCDIFVAVDADDNVLGFSQINPQMFEVEAVYVDPDHVRRGIGRALLAEVEGVAVAGGLRTLRLAASLNAAPFYRACGFVGDTEADYRLSSGTVVRCIPMTKRFES